MQFGATDFNKMLLYRSFVTSKFFHEGFAKRNGFIRYKKKESDRIVSRTKEKNIIMNKSAKIILQQFYEKSNPKKIWKSFNFSFITLS